MAEWNELEQRQQRAFLKMSIKMFKVKLKKYSLKSSYMRIKLVMLKHTFRYNLGQISSTKTFQFYI